MSRLLRMVGYFRKRLAMIARMPQIHLSLGSNIIKDTLQQLLLLLVEPPILGYPEYTIGFTLRGNATAKV